MKLSLYCCILCSIAFSGCWYYPDDPWNNGPVDTYVPIYATPGDSIRIVSLKPAQTQTAGGKIFLIGDLLLQVENNEGIHIIDCTDKKDPKRAGFIKIAGCREVAVKGNSLYANNFSDLVVLDIAAYPNVVVKARSANAFPELANNIPPQRGYYVCPDPTRGEVKGWEIKKVDKPKCYN